MEIDSSKILYLVGAVLGVATIVYFSAEIIVELSPTLKAAILFLGFFFFLAAAQYSESDLLGLVLYVLAAGSYVVFLGYTVLRFSLGENGVFLLLGVSSALFIGLGYALHEKELGLERRQALGVMAAVVLVAVAATGFDVLGPQPTVDSEFRDSVSLQDVDSPGDRVVVGTVTARNSFVLSRTAELPGLHACLLPVREIQPLSYRGEGGVVSTSMLLGGGEERSFEVSLQATAFFNRSARPPEIDDRYRNLSSLPVEREDECPRSDTGDPRIVVVDRPTPPRFD